MLTFTTGAALLDALVLSALSEEDAYGYKITQEVRDVVGISESTLYPVLRRLQKEGFLSTYDREYAGRNRRYYTITMLGNNKLSEYREDWIEYRNKIENLLFGGIHND